MADKGIIFSAPMVRALLDGRKTQTRRLIADAPEGDWYCDRGAVGLRWVAAPGAPSMPCRVPYAPGDLLYVREAWSVRGRYTDVIEVGYRASVRASHTEYVEQWPVAKAVPGKGKWPSWPDYGPSIHMPRWASRLWLKVTEVRVQRLQDISEADILAEGAPLDPNHRDCTQDGSNPYMCVLETWHGAATQTPRAWYHNLWDGLHAKPGDRWEDNPWVVAIGFDVQRGNIDG